MISNPSAPAVAVWRKREGFDFGPCERSYAAWAWNIQWGDMTDYVLFQMWGPFREQLIASHEFYVKEARDRLLAQFTEEAMKADADGFAEDRLGKMAPRFNPDRDDPGDYYERAYDAGVDFYLRMEALRDTTRLSPLESE